MLNRPWLDRMLDLEFTQAVVFGRDLSVAHIDLDRFKLINEQHGTAVGDKVLRSFAQVLQACVRGSDLVARFSGEEFIVVLPGTDRDIARQVAQRMLVAIADTNHDPDSGSIRVTSSIGVARTRRGSDSRARSPYWKRPIMLFMRQSFVAATASSALKIFPEPVALRWPRYAAEGAGWVRTYRQPYIYMYRYMYRPGRWQRVVWLRRTALRVRPHVRIRRRNFRAREIRSLLAT